MDKGIDAGNESDIIVGHGESKQQAETEAATSLPDQSSDWARAGEMVRREGSDSASFSDAAHGVVAGGVA